MTLTYLEAKQINHFCSAHYRELYKKITSDQISRPILPTIAVCVPNYNNSTVLEDVLKSILSQKHVTCNIYIMDNASSDSSCELLRKYSERYSNIKFVRHRTNVGSGVNCNILLRSTFEKYTLLVSGNDSLASDIDLAKMLYFLELNDGVDLVYGRNTRSNEFCEPPDFCFSVPSPTIKEQLKLLSYDCMDVATWLYTSNEPFWGLYRSSALKIIPSCQGYGSDHVLITALSANGGVAGIDLKFRNVDVERRDNQQLVRFQDPTVYSTNKSLSLHPLNSCNMSLLLRSYYFGLSELFIAGGGSNEIAIERSLDIIIQRFPSHFLRELNFISMHMSIQPPYADNYIGEFEWELDYNFVRYMLKKHYKLNLRNKMLWRFD